MVTQLSDAEHREHLEQLREVTPNVLPPEWREDSETGTFGGRVWRSRDGLLVLASMRVEDDGHSWLHLSFSRKDRLPSYRDCCRVKRVFIGPKNKAIQVFPSEDEHVNFHPRCLHLFHRLDGDSLPDFRDGTTL